MNESTGEIPVYVTRGLKYHTDPACRFMINGENLWDGDAEGYWHIAGGFRRTVPGVRAAAHGLGRLPCLGCVSQHLRMFPLLWGQTFGHRAVDQYALDNRTDGVRRMVCERCIVWSPLDGGLWMGVPVTWPCTTWSVLNRTTPPGDHSP